MKKCVCGGLLVVAVIGAVNVYVCKDCKREFHDDEPAKIVSQIDKQVIATYAASANATGTASASISPSAPPDGTS